MRNDAQPKRKESSLIMLYLNTAATTGKAKFLEQTCTCPLSNPNLRVPITSESEIYTSWPFQLFWESSHNQSLLREPLDWSTVNTVLQAQQHTGLNFKRSTWKQKTATLKSPCNAILLALIFGSTVVQDDFIKEETLDYFLSVAKHFGGLMFN